jgi:hypothetical protein
VFRKYDATGTSLSQKESSEWWILSRELGRGMSL